MWLCNSSIGRKVIMSVTGLCLILFLTFHMAMNLVAIISHDGYNKICEFLGANWYALVGTAGLAVLAVLHIVYAFILTAQNRKARGNNRYAVVDKPASVEWASQNMLALGIVVLLGLGLHLYNFWAHMMLPEILHKLGAHVNTIYAADGIHWIQETFSCWIYVILYIVWLGALWFHLTHGFWSAIQTLGTTNKIWFNRWRCIGNIWSTLVILGFLAVVVVYFLQGMGCCK